VCTIAFLLWRNIRLSLELINLPLAESSTDVFDRSEFIYDWNLNIIDNFKNRHIYETCQITPNLKMKLIRIHVSHFVLKMVLIFYPLKMTKF